MNTLKIKLLHEDSKIPTKAYQGDLGFDLYCIEEVLLQPNAVTKVRTGIACGFPDMYGALLRDRSSIATKQQVFVVAGVIDSGYENEILVAMFNPHQHIVKFDKHSKIAQMILTPVHSFDVEVVEEINNVGTRKLQGFGSSGI